MVAAIMAVGVLVVIVGTVFLGSQVSGILSTVGASVGMPGEGFGGDADGDGSGGSAGSEGSGGSGAGNGTSGSGGSGEGDGGTGTATFVDAARPDLLVIKTGEIALETTAVGRAIDDVTRRIVAMGGYVSASDRARDGGDRASITFRVPADRWEDALAAARGVGDRILDEHSGTQDVTGEVVDLRARIRNLQATEQAFQAIIAKASQIKDILAVQAELTTVRGEIERLTSAAASLEERAAYSTLKVLFSAPAAIESATPEPTEPAYDAAAEVEAATGQFVDNAEALTTAGIWFGIVWLPLLAGLAIGGLVVAFVVRRLMRMTGTGELTPNGDSGA